MPKIKTLRGAAKRFKKTGSGLYVHKQSHLRHGMIKKSTGQKRQLRPGQLVDARDHKSVARMLGDM